MNKTQKVLAWIIAILLGLTFVFLGGMKFLPVSQLAFDEFYLPDWLRLLIGGLEVLCGILLFIPVTSRISAIILAFITVGAITTTLFHAQAWNALFPLTILILLILLARWRGAPGKKVQAVSSTT